MITSAVANNLAEKVLLAHVWHTEQSAFLTAEFCTLGFWHRDLSMLQR